MCCVYRNIYIQNVQSYMQHQYTVESARSSSIHVSMLSYYFYVIGDARSFASHLWHSSSFAIYAVYSSSFAMSATIILVESHRLATTKDRRCCLAESSNSKSSPWSYFWKKYGVIHGQYGKLVGGWTNPFEKYARQIGSSPQGSG